MVEKGLALSCFSPCQPWKTSVYSICSVRNMATEKILNIETIPEYNDFLGVETQHPLVSVIDLSKAKPMLHMRQTFGFYAIFLKEIKNCDLTYGLQQYDYQEGSIVCLAPGQVIGIRDTGEMFQPRGLALCFDPELIRGTRLGRNIGEYTYFSYEVNEAVHLSDHERALFVDCWTKIKEELEYANDRFSKRMITKNIELLLNYCMRFYERQFMTRHSVNKDILIRFESLLNDYFVSGKAEENGLPSVKYCASELCLSPNYFGDLIKRETGRTAQTYIQYKVMDIAKERIMNPQYSISQIAYELGFRYPQHFTRLFKTIVKQTPNDYRKQGLTA